MLTFSQRKAYASRIRIYREIPGAQNPTTGEVPDPTISMIADNVPALYGYTQNDDDPTGEIGRVRRRSSLTEDMAEMEKTVDIRGNDLIIDKTPGSVTYGTVHRVEGSPKYAETQGARTTNCLFVQLMQDEKPRPELV